MSLLAGALAACGGGTRQDAKEKPAIYRMSIARVSFPSLQAVARTTDLELVVRNTGFKTVPSVVVTVDSFSYRSSFPGLADSRRPIWVVEHGPGAAANPPVQTQEVAYPGGAQTAYVSTWALGALAPGRAARFVWSVTPVKPGTYSLHFGVAAGLSGKATVTLSRSPLRRGLLVHIAPVPLRTHVNPNTGKVVPGPPRPASESS